METAKTPSQLFSESLKKGPNTGVKEEGRLRVRVIILELFGKGICDPVFLYRFEAHPIRPFI
jgi:hypothetical protein